MLSTKLARRLVRARGGGDRTGPLPGLDAAPCGEEGDPRGDDPNLSVVTELLRLRAAATPWFASMAA